MEGKYDKLTGRITKDVMRVMKQAIKSPNDKYKGYVIRKDPKKGHSLGQLFNSESNSIDIGDYNDNVSNVNLSVELQFKITETVPIGEYYLNGFADETVWSQLIVILAVNPNDGLKIMNKLNVAVREVVRHEIEHFTQRGDNVKPSKFIRNNNAMRTKIASNPEIGYKYLLLPDEVDANIHGLYARAKSAKKPYQKVIDDYLDNFVKNKEITQKQRDLVYKAWKKRIPKIGGLPNLR